MRCAADGRRRGRLPPDRGRRRRSSRRTPRRLELALERTDDVLAALAARRRPDQTLVGFAAEHGDGAVAYGRDKLARKGLDAVVVNDISRPDIGFDADANEVTIVDRDAASATSPRAAKAEVAARHPRRRVSRVLHPEEYNRGMEPLEPLDASRRKSSSAAAVVAHRIAANVGRAVEVARRRARLPAGRAGREGHVLIEDYPGVGKTALARSLPRSIDGHFARMQCTADLLPADVVGTDVYNQREERFEFRPGPIFANVVLVDEINRASPKTQSGLLECMQERHVTVDVHTHELARPFLVLATQNPIEYEGTYPLPEAQVDRFMVRALARLPERRRRGGRCSPPTRRGDRVLELEPVADADRGARPAGRGRPRARVARRCATTSSPCSGTRAPTRASSSARARVRA